MKLRKEGNIPRFFYFFPFFSSFSFLALHCRLVNFLRSSSMCLENIVKLPQHETWIHQRFVWHVHRNETLVSFELFTWSELGLEKANEDLNFLWCPLKNRRHFEDYRIRFRQSCIIVPVFYTFSLFRQSVFVAYLHAWYGNNCNRLFDLYPIEVD